LRTRVEFDFVDVPCESTPTPGIEKFFGPAYFVWTRYYVPPEVSRVHDYARAIVAQDSPHDGVIGFSEGAVLAAVLLIKDASDPDRQYATMFRIAVLINAANIVSPSTALRR
jgi:hypothetical protein